MILLPSVGRVAVYLFSCFFPVCSVVQPVHATRAQWLPLAAADGHYRSSLAPVQVAETHSVKSGVKNTRAHARLQQVDAGSVFFFF